MPAAERRDRPRSAFTFIELLVVVTILGIGILIASQITTGQSSYYYLRGDAERITAALQRAAVQSGSRGELANAPAPVTAGVSFYNGRFARNAVYENVGFSLFTWFENDPLQPVPRPAVPISNVLTTAITRTGLRTLQTETVLTQSYAPGIRPVPPLADQAFFRYRAGRLDVFLSNATPTDGTMGGPHLAELDGFFRPVNSTLAGVAGRTVAWTFDIVNLNCGWIRMRVSSGGFVESSGITPLNVAVPTTQTGAFFE